MHLYVSIRPLPDEVFPCHAVRDGGDTLLIVDPRASREEATAWCVDNLTQQERDFATVAYGQTPDALEPDFLEGPVLQWVPEPLRLPWEPAWQGERISA